MKCISMLILVLLLNRAVQYAMCDTIYIIPTADSPCPSAKIGQPCFTLEQYAASPSHSANVTLQLYPGNHSMDRVPLSISYINSFTMRATKPASVTVMCGQPHYKYYSFSFREVPTLLISDITFNGCKIGFSLSSARAANAVFVRNSFMNTTCNYIGVLNINSITSRYTSLVTVKECIFSDNIVLGGKTYLAVIFNRADGFENLTIDQSIFKNNFVSGKDSGAVSIYHNGGILNVLNSNFSNNEIANNLSGKAIYIDAAFNSTVLISNCHFNGNVASDSGGAIFASQVLNQISITNSSFINNKVISSNGLGGAIYADYTNITITNSIFIDNSAGSTNGFGGAVYVGS